jgi:Lar family restriction alleviation protein
MTDGTNPVIEPCPFCGSAAAVGEAEDHLGTIWPTVSCGTCPAEVTGHTEAKAIAAWNALAAPPANPVIVERVGLAVAAMIDVLNNECRDGLIEDEDFDEPAFRKRCSERIAQAALEAMPDEVGLREALEPFARYCDLNDLAERSDQDSAIEVPIRDLLNARAALAEVSGVSTPLPDSPPSS